MPIKLQKYNRAKAILTQAGSHTAGNSHQVHGQDDVPDRYGQSLLSEARDEFRGTDAGHGGLQSRMTPAHYKAIHEAAEVMGITDW
jgi:hypothetical protein